MARLYVILPAFNEAKNIAAVVAGVRAVTLDGVAITPVVVNDGSRDDTAAVAAAAGATVISHPVNRGVGAAFRTGLDRALDDGVEYLVHMDSDGQVPANEIPLLFEPVARDEADVAIGSRFIGGRSPEHLARWKAVALRTVAHSIGRLCGYDLWDLSCGFRCMNRRAMQVIRPSFDYDYIQETLIQAMAARLRVVEIPVHIHYEEEAGKAGLSARPFRYGRRFLGLTAYSMLNFYRARLQGRDGATANAR